MATTLQETEMPTIEDDLRRAQKISFELLDRIETENLVRAGRTERQVSEDIGALAEKLFGVSRHWHNPTVRSGPNTLIPGTKVPLSERVIGEDDIVYVDLGPILQRWKGDVGRTFCLGNDPAKAAICRDAEIVFTEAKSFFQSNSDIRASELFWQVRKLAERKGWAHTSPIAGHQIGCDPDDYFNDRIGSGNVRDLLINADNQMRLSQLRPDGGRTLWVLEVHLVDEDRKIGAFIEDFLNV